MSSWHIFKAVAANKVGEVRGFFKGKKQKDPIDSGLPFGLHIAGSIELEQTPFIIHGDDLNVKSPGKECLIEAYGTFAMHDSTIHRFYLQSATAEDKTAMLQLIVNPKDNQAVEECRLFCSADEVYPENQDEWGFWLSDDDGSIGWYAFEDKKGTHYDRAWGDSDADRISPQTFTETIYLDRFGENVSTVDHTAMLYGRWINETEGVAEYSLISAEEHNRNEALVHIMFGIDYEPATMIKVNY